MIQIPPALRPWPLRATLYALVALLLVTGAGAGCGKKGPPLAPLLRLPAAPAPFAAWRLGPTVYLRFAAPNKNRDNSTPADVTRVEVYGYTGTPASEEDFVKYGTLVATVPVRRPPTPEEEDRARARQATPASSDAARQAPPEREGEPGFDQGATITVTETLTEPLMRPVVVPRKKEKGAVPRTEEGPALLRLATIEDIPSRVYVAVGVNHKGQRGVFSPHAAVPLVAVPPPPSELKASYTETTITLEWTPPPGAPVPAPPKPDASANAEGDYLPWKPIVPGSAATWGYDVFEAPPGKAAPRPAAVPTVEPPEALNAQPLNAPGFTDSRLEFGVERCYTVRTINAFGGMREESEPSAVACVTPVDHFPPAAPRSLVSVASGGAISLNWEPNTEKDLDGYLVLRADAPDGTFERLTPAPVHETSYEDKSVKAGVRYVYAVVAVDKSGNISGQSNQISEIAR